MKEKETKKTKNGGGSSKETSPKMYLSAPLPFVGQKRMFAKEFIKVLEQYPDGTTFVDLFGGSGLLSHITRRMKPHSTVVYNDYDNYRQRLEAIPQTNDLLRQLRAVVGNTPKFSKIDEGKKRQILECIRRHEQEHGYVDFITVSSSVMFSMKYATSLEAMKKESLYHHMRTADYPLCGDYLDGLTIVSADYKEVFKQYKDVPGVVFLVDPPYLSTEVGTYNMCWRLSDYLDVLTVLSGHRFIYFTSNKSSIIELCQWIGKHKDIGNPFEGCHMVEFNQHMNHTAKYTDIMLYSPAA